MENLIDIKKLEFTFGSYENFQNFKKTSELFDVTLYTNAHTYVEILNYDYKYKNKLTKSDTLFNEVWLEVDKIRKGDFFNFKRTSFAICVECNKFSNKTFIYI